MRLRLLPFALLAVLALALVAFAGAGTATAKGCSPADYPGEGYFTSLRVKKTTCGKGRKVQKKHYSCRISNGGADGRCNSRVKGFRCRETKRNRTSTEINARVKCKKGGRKVKFTYQQNI